LCAALPREQWTLASSTLILHGRRICRPTQPMCPECAVVDQCLFAADMRTAAAQPPRAGAAARAARPPHTQPLARKAAPAPKPIRPTPAALARAGRKPTGRR
jgi:adenine-specific DNA glycosylase